MDQEEKVKENRIRRKLDRMGYCLVKSRAKDPQSFTFGGYMIKDAWTGSTLAGADPYDYCMKIDDVERYIKTKGPNPPKAKKPKKRG
jgi:hypothetical protein